MPEALPRLRQLALLVRVGGGRLDLRHLEAEQVKLPLAGSLPVTQLGQLALQPAHLGVDPCVPAPALEVPGPGETVEDVELG